MVPSFQIVATEQNHGRARTCDTKGPGACAVGFGRTLLIVVTFKMLLLFVGVGETLISGGLGQLSLAVLEFRVNQAAYDPDEGYVYFEFELMRRSLKW
jgi:hypothetical protein